MKRQLIIFANEFPFGKGEKAFIEPEIYALRKEYRVTLVSAARKSMLDRSEDTTSLPDDVSVIWCGKRNPALIAIGAVKGFFSRVGRTERELIWDSDCSFGRKMQRLLSSTLYYGLGWNLRYQIKSKGLFSDTKGTLYYSFWLGLCAMAIAIEKEKNSEIKLVCRLHGYDLYDHRAPFGWQQFQWYKADMCNAIFFASECGLNFFRAKHAKSVRDVEEKTDLLRIGTKPPDSIPLTKNSPNSKLVVSCSSVIPLKRVNLIAEALSTLSEMNVRWIHFGGGSELKQVTDLANSFNLDATFYGAVPNEEVKEFYRNNFVDCFISTSSSEGGCPVSIMEAMSFGIPIIGTNVGGIPEEVDGNGIIISSNPATDEIAGAIKEILSSDANKEKRMRNRSMEIHSALFDFQRNFERLQNSFERI